MGKLISKCLICGSACANRLARRVDGIWLMRCQCCQSIFVETIPEFIATIYQDDYFTLKGGIPKDGNVKLGYPQNYREAHENSNFYWAFRIADFALASVNPEARVGPRCLDIGCATGELLNVFSAHGYVTEGLELSPNARQIAGAQHRLHGAELMASGGPRDVFDVVSALEVLEHVEDVDAFLRTMHGLLKPRGVFFAYFPSADWAGFGLDADYHWLHESLEHLTYPSRQGIKRALTEVFGESVFLWSVSTHQHDGVIPWIVAVVVKDCPMPDHGRDCIAELMRQLCYISDHYWDFPDAKGPGALTAEWAKVLATQRKKVAADSPTDILRVAAVACAKQSLFGVSDFVAEILSRQATLTRGEMADLCAICIHRGGIDMLRQLVQRPDFAALPLPLRKSIQSHV